MPVFLPAPRAAQFLFAAFALSFVLLPTSARAATAITAAASLSIDTDADGITDLDSSGNSRDNAPSFNNPSQQDTDGDGYGDVIDPTPTSPGPFVDIGFQLDPGPYTVLPGAGVTINFTTTNSPPGNFGHINLMMTPGLTPDAVAFQSLATPGGSFFIPANLVTLPGLWDLNTPGTYTVEAWGLAPGEIGGYKGGDASVTVVPEPASLLLLAAGAALLWWRRPS
ncbi:MAG TPA: PEP-CTERM sorting domain-containing protein [Pirellulales bacterium]|jgi:hypothetical protein|nr:PEP-CTERM sorting domain-containing protein [Pirellulales bacterium]